MDAVGVAGRGGRRGRVGDRLGAGVGKGATRGVGGSTEIADALEGESRARRVLHRVDADGSRLRVDRGKSAGQRVGRGQRNRGRTRTVLECQRFRLARISGRACSAVDAVVGGEVAVVAISSVVSVVAVANGEGCASAEIQLAVGANLRVNPILIELAVQRTQNLRLGERGGDAATVAVTAVAALLLIRLKVKVCVAPFRKLAPGASRRTCCLSTPFHRQGRWYWPDRGPPHQPDSEDR